MPQNMDKLKRNFEQHNIAVFQVNNQQELLILLNEFISDASTVGCGDSFKLEQTGVFDYLRKRDITFLDKYLLGLSHEDKRGIYLHNFSADIFITGRLRYYWMPSVCVKGHRVPN